MAAPDRQTMNPVLASPVGRATISLLGLLACHCARGPKPGQESDPPSYVPVPVSSRGLSDADLSCSSNEDCEICSDGQCGEAMPRRRARALGIHCRQGSLCEPWNAECRAGRCASIPPPGAERCVRNADCEVCYEGSPCGQPMARARVARLGDRCQKPTTGDCRKPELVCHAGRCLDPKLLEY